MSKNTATISELQKAAASLVRRAEEGGVLNITRHGRTVAFVISQEMMEGILETVELQQIPELMKLVRRDRAGQVKYRPMPDEDED